MRAPLLIADIGGTNARFAVVSEDGSVTPLASVKNRDFATVEAAVLHALAENRGPVPATAVFAVACPVTAETFRLTNADWVLIDANDIIIHLFRPEVRSFYNLEKMWGVESNESPDE